MSAAIYAFQVEDDKDERQARLTAWITTGAIAAALFLTLFFVKIITPIPAIPPDPEVLTVEVGLVDGSGGDAEVRGGGSNGNTGTPGSPANDAAVSNDVKAPVDNGAVTDNNSDNPSMPNSNHTSQIDQPTVSPDVMAALAAWNKNKGKATIQVGGQGSGDPYTGGLGNGSGSDVGPGNGGDPGTGGPGGHNGNDPDGKSYRHILSKPQIVNPTQEEGKVVVIVHVDRNGNVIPGRNEIGLSSTTTNSVLRSTASQSAYKIKFDADPGAPADQAIAIDINFTLK